MKNHLVDDWSGVPSAPRGGFIAETPLSRTRLGFTLIELLTVIAIISLLAAILFPVFGRARENARRASCLSNLKQIGLGVMQYVQDWDEYYPISRGADYASMVSTNGTSWGEWKIRTYPYVKSEQVYNCPSGTVQKMGQFKNTPYGNLTFSETNSYGVNQLVFPDGSPTPPNVPQPVKSSRLGKTSELAMLADSAYPVWNFPNRVYNSNYTLDQTNVPNAIDPTLARHFEGSVVVYADGHAKYRTQSQMGPLAASPNTYQYGLAYDPNDPRLR